MQNSIALQLTFLSNGLVNCADFMNAPGGRQCVLNFVVGIRPSGGVEHSMKNGEVLPI